MNGTIRQGEAMQKLIQEVKKHKILYQKSCLYYRNPKKRQEAWNSISKTVQLKQSDCQALWKALRDRFVKELNKSDQSSDGVECNWKYFRQLEFLRGEIRSRNPDSLQCWQIPVKRLIDVVKMHRVIYDKNHLYYTDRKTRAETWKSIGKELQLSPSDCQAKWRSLRDRFVKHIHRQESGDVTKDGDSDWEFYPHLLFLREQIKLKKDAMPNTDVDELYGECSMENNAIEQESYVDSSDCVAMDLPILCTEEQTNSSSETLSTHYRRRKRRFSDDFAEFLEKMTEIAEKRFCGSKESEEHGAFYSLVSDMFRKLPEEDVADSKMFILNHLHEKIKAKSD